MKCQFCDRPVKIKSARICGAHDAQRRRSGLTHEQFAAAMHRGEQPGNVRRDCEVCDAEFSPYGAEKCCSPACHRERKLARGRAAKRRQYQRDPERAKRMQRERRAKNPEVYREMDKRKNNKARKHTHCDQCGQDLRPLHRKVRFCSDFCWRLWWQRENAVSQPSAAGALEGIALANLPPAGKYLWTCERCRKTFRGNKKAKYCSAACRRPGRVLITKPCERCGETFDTRYPQRKYCGCKPAKKPRKKQRPATPYKQCTCVICERQFLSVRGDAITCSVECRAEKKRRDMRHDWQPMTLTCRCGAEFVQKHPSQKHCSDRCNRRAKNERAVLRAAKQRDDHCVICGVSLVGRARRRKTCSDDCYKKWRALCHRQR